MLKSTNFKRVASLGMMLFFLITFIAFPLEANAQEAYLPKPGTLVHLSSEFNPPILRGIKVHPDDPFRFEFVLDTGDVGGDLKIESTKLIKYFLASLTIPEKDLWVNLSPYEKNRIVPESFGLTEMGRDLLAEDYILKQVTASLIYPEDEVGRKFWKRIYEEAERKYHTTNIPVNTFNKVWIVPEKAVVYENAKVGVAYVVESKLKVMLEEDYLAKQKHTSTTNDTSSIGANIIREIVIPELTKEINEGKNFIQLRQVYNSLILANWYKKKIKDSILALVYSDKNKVAGVNTDDPKEKERIYQQYLQAFKKGVYNYIKEDFDPLTQERVPRKYFSGGVNFLGNMAMTTLTHMNTVHDLTGRFHLVSALIKPAVSQDSMQASPTKNNSAMIAENHDSSINGYMESSPIEVQLPDMIRGASAVGLVQLAEQFIRSGVEIQVYRNGRKARMDSIIPLINLHIVRGDAIILRVSGLDKSSAEKVFREVRSYLGKDHAMKTNGGIDFNPNQIPLKIQNPQEVIKLRFDPSLLRELQSAPGFSPYIVKIQPLVDISAFLGMFNDQTRT